LSYDRLAIVCNGQLKDQKYSELFFDGVSIDSRTIEKDQLFIAIKGEQNDGHKFIDKAIKAGASGIMIESLPAGLKNSSSIAVVIVKDSYKAMLQLAAEYRNSLNAKFVAITGSNGKTTTKELMAQLISSVEEKTYHSPGNYNNLYGVPLSLFSINLDTEVVVMELGISTSDEMPLLSKLVKPDLIVITNIGASHLEFLNTIEEVAQAKLELVKNSSTNAPLLINSDDTILMQETKKIRTDFKTFALDSYADFKVENIEFTDTGFTYITIDGLKFHLPLLGRHQVYNLLAAYAGFKILGFDFNDIDTESIPLSTAPLRGQIDHIREITFYLDCYNANPASMKAGIEAFLKIPTDNRRVLVLGDMLELGDESENYHSEIGQMLEKYEFDCLIAVGPMSQFISDELDYSDPNREVYYFETVHEAIETFLEVLKPTDLVYLKASRGIGLEQLYQTFISEGEN
jgi:UDP-N-acetylmuramoyl-tripeptide--D-alanyl-D-alanine ligase